MTDLREDLLHLGTEALDGMRASVRWNPDSVLPMTDAWLAKVVIDAIWEHLMLALDDAFDKGLSQGNIGGGYD